jgi:pimeloyl-ACP methyl ester carboxylesterase
VTDPLGRLLAGLDRLVLSTVIRDSFTPRRHHGDCATSPGGERATSPAGERAAWLEQARQRVEALDESELLPTPGVLRPECAALRSCPGVSQRSTPHQCSVLRFTTPRVPAWTTLGLRRESGGSCSLLAEPPVRRSAVICLHSWWGGYWPLDCRVWPVKELLRAGHAVLLPTLPGHAYRLRSSLSRSLPQSSSNDGRSDDGRSDDGRSRSSFGGEWPPLWPWLVPRFPGRNPLRNFLTVADTILELRELIGWLLCRGYERVVVAGASLGGYLAALLATVEPRLHGCVLDRPLLGLSEPIRQAGSEDTELGSLLRSELKTFTVSVDGTRRQTHAQVLERLYRRLSPLARPAVISAARTRIILGYNDQITNPSSVQALADHFGVEPIFTAESHLVGLGRRRRMGQLLNAIVLI